MNHRILFRIVACFATLIGASPAWAAAACPANPLAALSGQWTFNIQATNNTLRPVVFGGLNYAIAGNFVATLGTDRSGNQIGVLTINATSRVDFSAVRLETDAGRYQINADCTGGTLTFNLSSRPMQFDFFFTATGIHIVSTSPLPAIGSAFRTAGGCPLGLTNPLSLLSGPYVVRLQPSWWNFDDPVVTSYVLSGRFVASTGTDRGGNPVGLLSLVATSQTAVGGGQTSVTRLERDAGSYQINSDCSGGTLTFNLSSRPIQLQFYFRGAGFSVLDLISTSGPSAFGVAYQAQPAGCPAVPLSLLSGTWTYNVQTDYVFPDRNSVTAAGQFRASIGQDRNGGAIGVLALNTTSILATSVTRLESDTGRFQINEDCTGGTLTLNLSSGPQQYDFWFYGNNQSMLMVSTLGNAPILGTATVGPAGCPVGLASPLNLLTGQWTFRIQPRWSNGNSEDALVQAGIMTASVGADRAGNPLGVLAITATSQNGFVGSVARLESDTGRYTVNDDCSGGTLTFNLSSRPMQYQYYFRGGFQEFDVISTSNQFVYSFGSFTR